MFENFLGKAADAISKGASAVQKGAEAVKKAQENANIISEGHPLSTAGLEIYPNRFKYQKQTFSFSDVTHLGIYWQSTTTNGVINTQEVNVTIIVDNDKKIYVSKTTMYVAPKLVKAYNFIAQQTFDHRLKFYTDQLEKKGFFDIENCFYHYKEAGFFGKKQKSISGSARIYTDGRVLFQDKKMSLFDATISNGRIDIKINSDESFAAVMHLNKDIIIALVTFILENPQNPDEYVANYKAYQNSKRSANIFLENSVSLMAKLSYADGVVSPEEIEIVQDFLTHTMKLSANDKAEIMILFNQVKNSPKPFEYYANILANNFEASSLSTILDVLFFIAIADGTISIEEELLLLEAEAIFGVKSTRYEEYKSRVHKRKTSNRGYYLEILGLSSDASQAEIKKTYKRLAMKFHPDRVNHLGEEFIKEAEIKMKEVNEAYEYLKNNVV